LLNNKKKSVNEKVAQEVKTIAKQTTGMATMSFNDTNRRLTLSPDSGLHRRDKCQGSKS